MMARIFIEGPFENGMQGLLTTGSDAVDGTLMRDSR
jgi:hypothetical protein